LRLFVWLLKKKGVLIACAITALITWLLTMYFSTYNQMFTYRYTKGLIERYYVDEINEKDLVEGSINGMFDALGDEHSLYVPSSYGYDKFDSNVTGEFVGIGVSIKNVDGNCVVSEVFENSPAELSGILANDIIIGADEMDLSGKDINEVANAIRGEEGTFVNITVLRNGEVIGCNNIERKAIKAPSIKIKTLNDNIAYIHITSFDGDTDKEISAALKDVKDKNSLIIDLRDNPGGRLDVVVKSIDLFLDQGAVLITKYKNDKENVIYSEDGVEYDKQVCVLVNENSASASEIFAAALKDRGRAKIVGTRTYGKGSIQRVFPLPGNAGANITIGRFYSPNRNIIDKVGVSPDIEIAIPDEFKDVSILEIPFEKDTQLQKTIEILKNDL